MRTDNFDAKKLPERLHFNEEPIEVCSNYESDLIKLLENSFIKVDSNELSFFRGLEQVRNSESLM